MTIDLHPEDWQRVLAILAQAPWATANPLIMSIGQQMRAQTSGGPSVWTERPPDVARPNGEDRPSPAQ
jgi:hypothetical protein